MGGSTDNVIPDTVYLEGTLRSFSTEIREQLIQEVERVLGITRTLGGDYDLKIERGYPPQLNDHRVAAWLRQVGVDLLGDTQVSDEQKTMGAEDFSFMTQITQGAMFTLGVKPADAQPRYLHTATFDLDEEALPIGCAILAETALRFLNQKF
jgi:amidohydrolase